MSNRLFWGLYFIVFVVSSTVGYALGQKHGRDQVYLKEVECVSHPLKQHKVLCKKARVTEELEIQWKS